MSDPTHGLERLISRYLDDECTRLERRELNAKLRRDPQAAALFEEHAALDREVKHALRAALRHTPERRRPLPPTAGDAFVENPERFKRPVNWVGKPEAKWIIVPSDRPGEYLVIEVNRVLTRYIHVQQDF